MHESLKVYLKDSFVGWLSHETVGDEYSFEYDKDYLAHPVDGALSFALPLSAEKFDSSRTFNFFANLLPPRVVRQRLGASLHLSQHNVFGFLKAIGGDCAGAVSLYPPWAKPTPQDVEETRELSEEEAVRILKSLKRRPLYAAGEEGYRYSGAGAQDKLIARVVDGKIVLPLYGTPSTHIIKPPADGFEDSVVNECFCQRLASEVGLSASRAEVILLGGERYYVSERYDREIVSGKPRRLHQEDFCQLLSVDPEMKYETDGGPSIADCMSVMRRMRMPATSQLAFIDSIAFNYIIGNADAHAKNISVVYLGKRAALAPMYDLVSTVVYPELSMDMAMGIGGKTRFSEMSRSNFSAMADACGISPKLVLSRLDALCLRTTSAAERLAEEFAASWPSDLYGKVIETIRSHAAQVAS
ncbi:MAG: type II toxin-antitoxin system HipA family toxin [Kiritimatiellae bacterium]|nr:type II toxin-antitoxin system HipA family toxin [Kiritimatiellia bacterium]